MSCAPSSDPSSAYSAQAPPVHLSSSQVAELMDAVLERGLPFRFAAPGFSMSPFILDGDLLTLAPFGSRPPSPGDVVAFTFPSSRRLFVHRLIALQGASCLVQGDNSPSGPDGLLPLSRLIGRVVRVERRGRRVQLGLGPERRLIALLSRHHLLVPWVARLVQIKRGLQR